MTPLEMRLIAALGKHAAQVTITLLADPDGEAFNQMRAKIAPATESFGLFARTERLHRRLTDEFRRHQVVVESTQGLRQRHRFGVAALGKIEAELFAEGQTVERGAPMAAREAAPPKKKAGRHAGAELPLFASPAADGSPASLLADATGGGGGKSGSQRSGNRSARRGGDPTMGDRRGAAALSGHRDCCAGFGGISRRDRAGFYRARDSAFHRSTAAASQYHPLVEFLQSAVAVATHRWDREDLLLYMKSRLAGVVAKRLCRWWKIISLSMASRMFHGMRGGTGSRAIKATTSPRKICRPAPRTFWHGSTAVR